MKKLLPLLTMAMSLVSCKKSNEEIVASHQWKFGEGAHDLGDWVNFPKKSNPLHNDTIFKDNIPTAIIDSVYHNYDHYILVIRSVKTGQKGLYFEKGEVD
ncbi:hypothetical protein ACLI1A_05555 [Flavobacterium sp. RHBU_3]|uniref:hypothetical protein n=1 Tax=Flavobacterium sp. RHBU_3 TaxID=3391184 RepID=UPI003984A8AA